MSFPPQTISQSFRLRISRADDFASALDCLMEITGDLGFTQVLYAYMPRAPRLPNGDWLPLKLNVRNFPDHWEDEWRQIVTFDHTGVFRPAAWACG